MLWVKSEFYPLDWYSSSPTAIVLYTKESICVKRFQAIAKSSKEKNLIYMKKVLYRLRHFDVKRFCHKHCLSKRCNLFQNAKPILGKIHIT